jgi:hypothetical protein
VRGREIGAPEATGILALAQTRLYVYLDRETRTVHLITLGDKGSQRADIKFSSEFVESLNKGKGSESHG